MSLLSVLLTDLMWIAIAVGIASLLARSFTWRSPLVYGAVVATGVELVFVGLTGEYNLGGLLWSAVAIGVTVWLYWRESASRSGSNR